MSTHHGGGCLCGKLRFTVDGPALYSCFCHCRSCQHASGGAYVPWATFDRETFVVTDGELAICHSSPGVTRGHCPECGTSISYEHERRTGQVDITLTSFDDPGSFEPVSHIWVEDKAPWVTIADDLPQFEKTAS